MINTYKETIENELSHYLDWKNYKLEECFPKDIFKAMAYTTLLPAKRLRGILCLEACRVCSKDYKKALPTACAIEMLHAQSLIHDDLPAMDNDDLRRGKPSNHKVFGEAIAILAGDALISFGAQIILQNTLINKNKILLHYLKSAGVFGIVGGQTLDIISEKKKISKAKLYTIQKLKTASLFECALVSGAYCGGAKLKKLKAIRNFAENFGVAFQIVDDILDVTSTSDVLGKTIGKDENVEKATYVSICGLDEARKKANYLIDECYAILKQGEIKSKVFDEILKKLKSKLRSK